MTESTAAQTAAGTSTSTAPRARFEVHDLTRIAVFAALIAVLGQISIPLPFGVPITLQTLGVILAGAVLGSWRGAASVLVVLLLAAIGLPVLAGGGGGIATFAGPSVGYLIGFVIGAFVIGLIARTDVAAPVWWRTLLAGFVGAFLVVYSIGLPLQALVLGQPLGTTIVTSLPAFLPGDTIKLVLAVIITQLLWKAYPRAFGNRGQVRATDAQR